MTISNAKRLSAIALALAAPPAPPMPKPMKASIP